jgi:ring-1,2-phenylacetyl-CoA epoxidase subunit PaaC
MTLEDELLCVADTKLVMGNWLAETVMNGRSLPDFAAMLGMCTTSYGQARALYQFVSDGQQGYAALERGRGPEEIRSMNVLDAPPRNWSDLVLTIWLAERATWTLASGFLGHPDRRVAALARKIGEEAYFHLKYATGWFKVLAADDDASRRELAESVAWRLPLAACWFGPADAADPLAGQRAEPVGELRSRFLLDVAAEIKAVGLEPPADGELADGVALPPWRPEARRRGPLPAGLYEVVRFKDPAVAH